jgi:hypothetical protein
LVSGIEPLGTQMTRHNGTAILAALIALSCGTTRYGGFSCAGQDLAESGAQKPRDEWVDPIRVLSVEQARRLEGKIQHVYAAHAPAVVRIGAHRWVGSGTPNLRITSTRFEWVGKKVGGRTNNHFVEYILFFEELRP